MFAAMWLLLAFAQVLRRHGQGRVDRLEPAAAMPWAMATSGYILAQDLTGLG